ncbi:MAG: DUF2341 domain-containing protein [Bdellovibrionales bacterium]|nr:DUF2341 domain-containing protein [Bdellovibrionales bacterium]
MLFHLLGAGQPIANFTTTSQTVAESTGVWAGWSSNLSAWTKRRQILVDGVGGALTDFPVMIKLDSTRIDYAETQAAGQDLRFTNDAGTLLSYEIEKWDEAGNSIVWVKVPALAAYPTKSSIWMYYGNASASDAQSPTTWDANHIGVWHLRGNGTDATSNSNSGTVSGPVSAVGQVSDGMAFNGTAGQSIRLPDTLLSNKSVATFEGWFKTTAADVVLLGWGNQVYPTAATSYVPNLAVTSDGIMRAEQWIGANSPIAGGIVNDGAWHHVALAISAASQSLYVDGVLKGVLAGSVAPFASTINYIGMGYTTNWNPTAGGWRSFNGSLDEFRVSTVARSADWIQATYLAARDELTTFRSEETPTSGAAIITVQLNTSATTTITIPYTVSGTATAGTDHSRVSGNLVINGGSSSGSLNTYVLRDNLVEGSETAILTLGAPTGASLGPDTVHTVTITDEVLSPPDAINDSINITNFNAVTIPVLANDTDANGDTLTITAVSSPTAGTAVRVGQTIRYTPTQDFPATDSFTYTISDGRGGTDTATVTIGYQIPFTWIGSGADANWTTTANWLGGIVPGASDTAYFNNQCTSYCNPQINANISVQGLRMNTSFSGTIAQAAANTVTVGAAGWDQKAGTFSGGSASITLSSGALTVTGGTFTSTSGTLLVTTGNLTANYTQVTFGAGATIATNSGTVQFNGFSAWGVNPTITIDVPNNFAFNNLIAHQSATANNNTITYAPVSGRTIVVQGNLTHGMSAYAAPSGVSRLDGLWDVRGNLVIGSDAIGGVGNISLTGAAGQTITSDAAGLTCDLTVNKTGGSVTASSATLRARRFFLDQGTFNAPSSVLEAYGYKASGTSTVFRIASGTTYVKGTSALKITADSNWGVNPIYEIDVPDLYQFGAVTLGQATAANANSVWYRPMATRTIVALGNLAFGTNAFVAASGKMSVYGLWETQGNYSVGTENKGGSASVTLSGTSAQSVTFASGAIVPSGTLTVNKASGTAALTAAASLATAGQDLSVTSGILNLAGFNLTVNDVLTVSSGAKLLCNGGVVTAGTSAISGEISCGTSLGITWLGTSGDGLWTTAGNWTNNTIPGASDIAYFNGSCTNCNATVNSAISVKGIVMASTYTGTLTQGAGNVITVGTSGWNIAGGTFTGGDAAVSINDTFAISGGTYTATSATTSVGSTTGPCSVNTPLNVTGGTFNHGNGRVKVYGGRTIGQSCNATAQLVFPVGFTVYDFELSAYITQGGWRSNATAPSATTITVAHHFYDYGHGYSFTVDLKGDLYTNRNENVNTGVVRVSGTTDQYYTYTAGSAGSSTIRVDKASGTFQPAGGVTELTAWSLELLQGAFTAPSGNLNLGATTSSTTNHNALLVSSGTSFSTNGGTIRFNLARDAGASASTVSTISVPAGFTFNNVEMNGNAPHYAFFDDVNSATTLVVNGNLVFAGKRNNANWDVLGNITVNGYANSGTGTIRAAGSANQTVTGTSTAWFSHFAIASTGGIVTLAGTPSFSRNFTYTSGTVDAGTSTVSFYAETGYTNVLTPGVMTFNNVKFDGYTGVFTLTGTMDVAGTLSLASITSSPPASINTGTVLARGPIACTNYGVTGTGLIKVGGSSNQTVSGTSGVNIPNFEIASTGGTVTYSGTLNFIKSYTHTSGTVDAGTSTVQLATGSTSSQTFVPGATVFNNLILGGYNTVYTMTGTATANGTLTFNSYTGSPAASYNSGAIVAKGNVVFSTYGALGNVTLSYEGSTNTTLSLSGSVSKPTGLVTVNKSGGAKVTLLSNYALSAAGQDLSISGGTFDLGGYVLTVPDVVTVGVGSTLKCSGGTFSSTSIVNSGTINCPGYSGYDFNWTGAGGNSNWNTAANWAGGVVPTTTDVPAFQDTHCGANCNAVMNVNVDVKGLQMLSPYTGTITQASGSTITIGSTGWSQAAGTFAGGDAAISNSGKFDLSGGTFTSTSGNLLTRGNIAISGGTFNHNAGTWQVGAPYPTSRTISMGTISVNNFEFLQDINYDGYSMTVTGAITVNGSFFLRDKGGPTASTISGGTLYLKGDATVVAAAAGIYSSLTVVVNGSGNQTLTSPVSFRGLGHLQIASTGGTVTMATPFKHTGNFTYTSGAVVGPADLTLSTVYTSSRTLNFGSIALQNVTFVSQNGWDGYTLTTVGTSVVNGDLAFSASGGTAPVLNSGTIDVKGNVTATGTGVPWSGSTGVSFSGTAATTINVATGSSFPKGAIVVNKTGGGSVALTSAVTFNGASQDLTITAGTLDMAGYNLTVGRNISNSGTLKRGNSPTCGTVSQGGTYSGTAAICP